MMPATPCGAVSILRKSTPPFAMSLALTTWPAATSARTIAPAPQQGSHT